MAAKREIVTWGSGLGLVARPRRQTPAGAHPLGRWILVLALMTAASSPAAAQSSPAEPDSDPDPDPAPAPDPDPDPDPDPAPDPASPASRLDVPSSAAPITGTWLLDDGVGEEVPWNDFDPVAHFGPAGRAHFGVQLRGGGLLGAQYPTPAGPWFEAGLFFDFRFSQRSFWRLRIVAAMTLQATGRAYGPAADESNAFSMRLRVLPISADLGDWITARAGGGVSLFWANLPSGGGAFQVYPDLTGELVVRSFEGRLEIGLFASLDFTAVTHSFGAGGDAHGVLGLSVGYILQ